MSAKIKLFAGHTPLKRLQIFYVVILYAYFLKLRQVVMRFLEEEISADWF
jgi:hypothetical protein